MDASAVVTGSDRPVIAEDRNKGENFSMRVDQFEAQYKYDLVGQPSKDSLWVRGGINVWDQREFGSRQANDTYHCFVAKAGQGKSCHILSQRQGIDWNTFEVTPMLEARCGAVNISYSHTLRVFSVNDSTVLGTYAGNTSFLTGTFPYDIVPETVFNMDKLKVAVNLNDHNHIYTYGYFGYVENSEAGVSREMSGADFRWTNSAIQGVTLSTYFKNYNQGGDRPTSLTTPDAIAGLTPAQQAAELAQLRNPLGYNRYTVGEKFNWRPRSDDPDSFVGRVSITGGYEFDHLIRRNQTWYLPSLSYTPPAYLPTPTTPILLQPNTTSNTFFIGAQVPWIDGVHTYVRYKAKFIQDAIVGFNEFDGAVNSNQPALENIIEFGFTWLPSVNFGISGNQTIELASRQGGPQPLNPNGTIFATGPGDVLNFNENSYSTSLVTWYRPTDQLTFSLNADWFSNQIKQDISIGNDLATSAVVGPPFVSYAPFTSTWSYGGNALEFGGSMSYQCRSDLLLFAEYEVTFGRDLVTNGNFGFLSGTPPVTTYIPLGGYSAVRNVMQQAKLGVQWKPRDRFSAYLTYQYLGFTDRSDPTNNGLMSMILGGGKFIW
jgi:hypothetical protein